MGAWGKRSAVLGSIGIFGKRVLAVVVRAESGE
jgi:hypothetical protein